MRFKTIYLNKPYEPSEELKKGCRALWAYVNAVPADVVDNHLFREFAKEHDTTPSEMNRHWRCIEARYKCHDC